MLQIPSDPTGLPSKVFNAHLDNMMETGMFNPDMFPLMSEFQQGVINEVKKSLKRIKNKYEAITSTEDTESPEEPV